MRRLLLACLFLMALITHASNYNIRDYGAKGDVVIDTNRDGIDIDCCKYVTVSNCKVNTPNDDAIVLKSSYAQTFELRQVNDSLHHLVLTTGEEQDVWVLRYPVYRFCVADVNGDGVEEALVGVVKSTRFFKDKGRRLFIFKNYKGLVRPLWMGSRIGGSLLDFKVVDGVIRCISKMGTDRICVAEFRMARFGLEFVRFLEDGTDEKKAWEVFRQ